VAKTFFPEAHRMVPASAPHPAGTQYKVSLGMEDWDGAYQPVIKVQMVYAGQVKGRKSPSYPLEADDYYLVYKAIRELMKACGWPLPPGVQTKRR